jgi:hypothetical protein
MTVCPRERLEWCYSPPPTSSANEDDGYYDDDEPSIGTNGSLFGGRSCLCDCERDQGQWRAIFENPGQ